MMKKQGTLYKKKPQNQRLENKQQEEKTPLPKKKLLFKRNQEKTKKNQARTGRPPLKPRKKPSRRPSKRTSQRSHFTRLLNPFIAVNTAIRKHESSIQVWLVPTILFLFLVTITLLDISLKQQTSNQSLIDTIVQQPVKPYPIFHIVNEPQITAKAAIIVDNDSQRILYEKNPAIHFSMASTTKIMTALTALDYYKLSDVLTVKREGVEGSGINLFKGEQMTFENLLYAMLLPSANDAAYAIADNFPGGAPAFVTKMNEKTIDFHLTNTHYADPAGLNDDEDYTTVVDLARLTSQVITNKTIARIIATKHKTITSADGMNIYELSNLNRLLGVNGVNGVKTGSTEGAGEVLITSTIRDGHTYIIIVMKSEDRFRDTENLLALLSNVTYFTPDILSSRPY